MVIALSGYVQEADRTTTKPGSQTNTGFYQMKNYPFAISQKIR
jgi:hypothetical protein